MALEFLTSILIFLFFSFLIILPFLYDLSTRFRYCFKYTVYYCSASLLSIILVPVVLLRPFHVSNLRIACRVFGLISKVLTIKWTVIPTEKLKLKEPCIYISYQQCSLDLLGFSELCPYLNNCVVTTDKEKLYFSGPFGLLAWLCDTIFIDNQKNKFSKCVLDLKIEELKNDNISLFLFLNRKKKSTEKVTNFEKSFYLAITKQLPIVPVVFSNYYFLDKQRKIFDSGNVTIEILSPIDTKKFSVHDIPVLAEETNRKMLNSFKKLSSQLTPLTLTELKKSYLC